MFVSYLLRTPPRSEALRHSGGERRLWTSATVTLYFDVELSRERRPGTEQKTSVGAGGAAVAAVPVVASAPPAPPPPPFLSVSRDPLRKPVGEPSMSSSSIYKTV